MAESARPLGAPEEQPTPTPTPVSGVIQTIRPAEVANIEDSTHDLLGTALDELGIEPKNDTEGVVISMDSARAAQLAKEAATKAKLRPLGQVTKELEQPSFSANPAPETSDNGTSAAE